MVHPTRRLAVRLALAVGALAAPASLPARHVIAEGETAPPFELAGRDGKAVASRAFAGRVAVILFVRPGQERSVAALRDAGIVRAGLEQPPWELLAIVSGDFTAEAVAGLIDASKFSGTVLLDRSMKVYGEYGVIVTPSAVVVGRDGRVAFSKAGHDYEFETALGAHLRFTLGLIDAPARDKLIEEGRSVVTAHSKVARLLGLARNLRRRGEIEKAEELVRKALAEDAASTEAQAELAEILLARKEPAAALALLDKEPPAARAAGPFRLLRGRALAALGKAKEAEAEFREAIVRDPQAGRAHYELGKLYEAMGRKDEAIRELLVACEKLLEGR